MLCVCTKRVCVRFTELVCKAVPLAFSCQTGAISFHLIPIPWVVVNAALKEVLNIIIKKKNFKTFYSTTHRENHKRQICMYKYHSEDLVDCSQQITPKT